MSTALATGLLVAASAADGVLQSALWAVALLVDVGAPALLFSEGWQLVPSHFAERHGLILIIALGESIVAIGVGSDAVVDLGVVVAATLGIAIAAALWWLYFDVTVWLAERRLSRATPGKEQNELARDASAAMAEPMMPPMSAWLELEGSPRYHVIRFHVIAPTRPARTTSSVIASAFTIPVATVAATLIETNAPRKLSTAALSTARRGESARVETLVAIEFAVS